MPSKPSRDAAPKVIKAASCQAARCAREDEMALASEIGQSLLSEVRRLQGEVQQYRSTVAALELEKIEQQRHMDSVSKQLRQKNEIEGNYTVRVRVSTPLIPWPEKLKEQVWDLELVKQEQEQAAEDLMARLARTKREAANAQDEQLQAATVAWQASIDALRQEHENRVTALRKSIQSLKREKNALQHQQRQQQPAALSLGVANGPRGEALHGQGNHRSDDHQQQAYSMQGCALPQLTASSECRSSCPDPGTVRRLEFENQTLQTSLEYAQSTVRALQEELDGERFKRNEIDNLLREAQEMIERFSSRSQGADLHQYADEGEEDKGEEQDVEQDEKEDMTDVLRMRRTLGDELLLATYTTAAPDEDADREEMNTRRDTQKQNMLKQSQKALSGREWTIEQQPPITNIEPPREKPPPMPATQKTEPSEGSESCSSSEGMSDKDYYDSRQPHVETQCYAEDKTHKLGAETISPVRANAFDFDPAFMGDKQPPFNLDRNALSFNSGTTCNLVPAVTRTMIGDWMYKYTRRAVGSGISQKRHRRFFWIHPYTQTLYWAPQEPGASGNNGSQTKSAAILSFSIVFSDKEDEPLPPPLVIETPKRSVQIQCLDVMAHRAWLKVRQALALSP